MSKEHELCENYDYYSIISGFTEIKARKIVSSNKK